MPVESPQKEKAIRDFESFLDELCAHIRVVGGTGDPMTFRTMKLEELYKHLHPNDIIIGFRNTRMRAEYQLSYQMKGGI
jgi:hypothetical protein